MSDIDNVATTLYNINIIHVCSHHCTYAVMCDQYWYNFTVIIVQLMWPCLKPEHAILCYTCKDDIHFILWFTFHATSHTERKWAIKYCIMCMSESVGGHRSTQLQVFIHKPHKLYTYLHMLCIYGFVS